MAVSCCVRFTADSPFDPCYGEIHYDKDLSTLQLRVRGQLLPDFGPSLVVLHCPFSNLFVDVCFVYWSRDCGVELRLLCHARGRFAGCHDVELSDTRCRINRVSRLKLWVLQSKLEVLAGFAF